MGLESFCPGIEQRKVAMIGDRKKNFFSALLLVALFAAVFAAAWIYLKPKDAAKPGSFGALAMSADSGIYGAAWGFHDPASAQKRSLEECSRSGGGNCVIKASLKGNCGSLVTSGQARQSYVATDSDKFKAAAFGMAQCQAAGAPDCTVREQFCGNGG
jgi:hypothetical protein